MARRSWNDVINPRDVVKSLGEPDPHKVLQLLKTAESFHKQRKFHETSALLEATQLALTTWIQGEANRRRAEHQAATAWLQWPKEIALEARSTPAAAAPVYSSAAGGAGTHVDSLQSNSPGSQVASSSAASVNSLATRSTTIHPLDYGSAPDTPCGCGHVQDWHRPGGSTCSFTWSDGKRCGCSTYRGTVRGAPYAPPSYLSPDSAARLPPASFSPGPAAEFNDDLCSCGHFRSRHNHPTGGCAATDDNRDACECEDFELAPGYDDEGGDDE